MYHCGAFWASYKYLSLLLKYRVRAIRDLGVSISVPCVMVDNFNSSKQKVNSFFNSFDLILYCYFFNTKITKFYIFVPFLRGGQHKV